jgi:putative FmdB family regulatory protein
MYEYECDACGHRFETLQRMSDDPLKDCPACEQPQLRKLISAAAFKLKGQGWYESDFKNPAKTANGKSEGADKPADSGGGADTKASESAASDKSSGGNSEGKVAKKEASAKASTDKSGSVDS